METQHLFLKQRNFNFVLNQRVGKIIPYEEKADKLFLHYLLSTQLVRDQIEATASGTKQRNTSPDINIMMLTVMGS